MKGIETLYQGLGVGQKDMHILLYSGGGGGSNVSNNFLKYIFQHLSPVVEDL